MTEAAGHGGTLRANGRLAFVVDVSCLLVDKLGRLLMMRRAGSGHYDGFWSLPAGHPEDGESFADALVRELLEELALTIRLDDLELVCTMQRPAEPDRISLFFKCERWSGTPRIMEPQKCSELCWTEAGASIVDVVPYVSAAMAAISDPLRGRFIAWGPRVT